MSDSKTQTTPHQSLRVQYSVPMEPDIGAWICALRNTLHLVKAKGITMHNLEGRLSDIAEMMVEADRARRI